MKIATTAVIQYNDKILLGLRKRDGRWELPGGKVDEGETPEQCVVREVREELGIDVSVIRFLETVSGMYRGIPMRVFAYLTRYLKGKIVLNVHHEIRQVSMDEIASYDIVEEDNLILNRLKQGYYDHET